MRAGHRLAVPRGGIRAISRVSKPTISTTIITPTTTVVSNVCRANLLAASARLACDDGRTSCVSEVATRPKRRARYFGDSPAPSWADMLLGAFGTEDRDRNRSALRNIIAVDAGRHIVTQPDRFGTLDKPALRSLLHQCEAATALAEEIRGSRSVRQQRRGAGHEDQARLVKTGGRRFRPDAGHVAQRPRNLGAGE